MMSEKCNELFHELWWLSDDEDAMKKFVEAMKYWVVIHNKGNIKICLIDLHEQESSFPRGHLYIGYDDCGGCTNPMIYSTSEFIEYIQDVYNDNSNSYLEDYWINKLNGILNN